MMERTSTMIEKPRETTPAASQALAVHGQRRITAAEQLRLYELEMQGQKPLLGACAYSRVGIA